MTGLLIALTGCALSLAQRIEDQARHYGFIRKVIRGKDFSHVVFINTSHQRSGLLHVYLEGDGRPWIHEQFVASDPTPKRSFMLRLMALDPAPSIYVGRPCYFGLAFRPPCNPQFWTYGRYSQLVVDSMADVIEQLVNMEATQSLILIGHSGGGTLAMLLAEQLPKTRAIVTIAGNLDPDAWTLSHGYSPLSTSLNPTRRAPLDPAVQQLHLVGSRDRNIPPAMLRAAAAHQRSAEVRVISDFNHICCWHKIWFSILISLAKGEFGPKFD